MRGATYMLATMACYGVMGVAMFSFGVGIAMERGQGWLQVKRASPMPLPAYFLAKIVNAMVFATVIVVLLLAVGTAFGGVRLTASPRCEAGVHPGSRVDSIQRHGTGTGILRETEFGAGHGQPGLPAYVVLLWLVDSAVHAAARSCRRSHRCCRRIT